MTTYTRLTLIGAGRRAELVVPDAEPVAGMIPDILHLLGHAPGPVALVTRTGDQLDVARSLVEQDVADGTPVWVTPVDAAPPPAQVADITDLTADTHDTRPDTWTRRWALVAAAPAVAVLAFWASRDLEQVAAASVLVALVGAACLLGRISREPASAAAVVLAAAGVGVAVTTSLTLPDAKPAWLVGLACFGLTAAVIALVAVIGFADRALGVGAATGTVLVLAVFAIVEAGASAANAAATVAVLAVVVLSVAPGIAMTTSGLTGLDDRLVTGHDTPRTKARATVDAAYRSLTWLTVACATIAAVCSAVAAGETPWGRWLAVGTCVVLVLRMRVLPLVPQRLALVAGALAVAVALIVGLPPGQATTIALTLAALVMVIVVVRPSPVVIARLNRVADFLETAAVVALVPLLLAQWGVFADLAGAFG